MPTRFQRERLRAFADVIRETHDSCSRCKQMVPWRALEFDCIPTVPQMIQLSWGLKKIGAVLDGAPVICQNCLAVEVK